MTAPVFDADSPYAPVGFEVSGRYVRLRLPKRMERHPVADKRGRVMAHRAVLFDAIGPGPHDCALCGWSGLQWDADDKDPLYLIVDHVDGDALNNRLDNLRPTDKWCNDNRSIIEAMGLPWSTWADTPLGDRPPLRNVHTGAPTRAAYELASTPAPGVDELSPPCRRREPEPAVAALAAETTWTPGRPVVWADIVDLGELARGHVMLRPPPAELLERFPVLRSIDFGVFGR